MKMSSSTSSPSNRSMTQSITGRPATLSIGFGTRCVCGRRRVPFPASGMITCMGLPSAVAVFEPDQVVELWRGCLEHVAVHDGLDLVHEERRDVGALAGPEGAGDEPVAVPRAEDELAGEDMHRLVLPVVVLEAEDVPRLHVQHLADIAVGAGPDELVAPRLLHTVRHVPHYASARVSRSDDGIVTQARTQSPHPTHASGRMTGCPVSSIASAAGPTGQTPAQTPHALPWKVMQRSGSRVSSPSR